MASSSSYLFLFSFISIYETITLPMPSLTLPMNLPGKSITKSRILLAKIFEGLWDIHLKKSMSKSIVDVIKYGNLQLYRAYSAGFLKLAINDKYINKQIPFLYMRQCVSKITCLEENNTKCNMLNNFTFNHLKNL